MTIEASRNPHPIYFAGAFATGGLLTFMVHLNGELARYGNPLFSSTASRPRFGRTRPESFSLSAE